MRNFTLAILLLISTFAQSQAILKGTIRDEKGDPLSFANVFIKGTQIGTTCGENGKYELHLKPGNYQIVFQFIGFNQLIKDVTMGEKEVQILDVTLTSSSYQLGEATIKATAEDPAYPIMRQVIARRAVYKLEAKEYQCKVYMKGLQRLTTIPKRVMLMKVPEDVKPGIVYLSESLSELSFQRPDKIKERMISSKVSGDNRAFSWNQAAALQFTLYDNMVPSFGLNQRGFVSPIANNAMFYYKYKLIGESKENNLTIFKIQLIPIRKSDPVFKGHIYIVKDSWRLHSTDLILDKESNIEFVDTLYIKQNYAPQPGGVWMPVSQRLIFHLGILGFRGNGYFVSVYSNYKVLSSYPSTFYNNENTAIVENHLTPQVRKVDKIQVDGMKIKPPKKRKKSDSTVIDTTLFNDKYFGKEVMVVEKGSNKTDDSTWNAIRPIPLTEEEVQDYHVKDSVEVVENSKPYLDSIDRKNNIPDWSDFIIGGYTYARSYEHQYFSVDPILTVLQYNTVEGLVCNPEIRFSRRYEDQRWYNISPHLRYGMASKKLYAEISGAYQFDPIKNSTIEISGGQFIEQYNGNEPISPFINSLYTLGVKENNMKLYQKGYMRTGYSGEVVNGILLKSTIEYSRRISLENNTDFTFNERKNKEFTSNIPVNKEIGNTWFAANNAFIIDITSRITFDQRYATRPDNKINYGSKYPKLYFQYRKGVPIFNSVVDFDEFNLWLNDRMDFNLFGTMYYRVKGGTFLNSRKLYFTDFHHFEGNQTALGIKGYNGFQLLDYYRYSTAGSYLEGHISHHFNGFILNKFPLIRKLKWQEVFTLNYLKTSSLNQYIEYGIGIEHIFKLLRVDYFQSFSDDGFKQGIIVGFGF